MCGSLEIDDVKFGVYDKSQVCTPLEHVVLTFLIYLCLMQAISFAVLYSFAKFGPEVTSSCNQLSSLPGVTAADIPQAIARRKDYLH